MAEISAAQVMALRKKTDLPMMDCKSALNEAGGDDEKALQILNEKYRGKFETKSEREATEGMIGIYVSPDAKSAGMIELRCETAQVAKTELFQGLAAGLAQLVADQAEVEPSPDAIMACSMPGNPSVSVKDRFGEVFGKLGENMILARCRKMTGEHIAEYGHYTGKVGSMVALDAVPSPSEVGRDLCQHVAFSKPLAITRDDVPESKREEVLQAARKDAREAGKPQQIVDKIAEGKLNAWCAENCLVDQEHVKVNKTSVKDVLKQAGVSKVTDLAVFELGA